MPRVHLKVKQTFEFHKMVNDQKSDIFNVHIMFAQEPNFASKNEKKKSKWIELEFSNFYDRFFVPKRLKNREDKNSNQYNFVLKKIEIT